MTPEEIQSITNLMKALSDLDKGLEAILQSLPPPIPHLEPLASRRMLKERDERIAYLEEVETALHKRIAELEAEAERLKEALKKISKLSGLECRHTTEYAANLLIEEAHTIAEQALCQDTGAVE